jgi:predicted flap endonuclease-1-like 5' DNA nuclease
MSKLDIIEGIGEAYAAKLEAAGVKSIEELLETCAKNLFS